MKSKTYKVREGGCISVTELPRDDGHEFFYKPGEEGISQAKPDTSSYKYLDQENPEPVNRSNPDSLLPYPIGFAKEGRSQKKKNNPAQ